MNSGVQLEVEDNKSIGKCPKRDKCLLMRLLTLLLLPHAFIDKIIAQIKGLGERTGDFHRLTVVCDPMFY